MTTSEPLFTSRRERRLWFWALAVVVAIYSTLGLAGTLVSVLGDRTVGFGWFWGFIVLVAAIAWSGWTRRPGRFELWVGVGVTAAYAMAFFRLGLGPAERTHLFEYGLVAVLIHQALLERRSNGRPVPVPGIIAIGVTVLLGWVDESIQWLLPNRVYDIVDVGFNALAALMSVTASSALARARRWDYERRAAD
ncbi:MAG: VanZ family protein [Gemmatimonadota bacterium]|nr:VanZ family protein [Gemmatimonadota bacterium]